MDGMTKVDNNYKILRTKWKKWNLKDKNDKTPNFRERNLYFSLKFMTLTYFVLYFIGRINSRKRK